ncbi:hypothetical protein JXM67_01195 [candidate division WOR-3 bacterium]|nr:hypothetical protein [candidate division WOR-3 bacterium]
MEIFSSIITGVFMVLSAVVGGVIALIINQLSRGESIFGVSGKGNTPRKAKALYKKWKKTIDNVVSKEGTPGSYDTDTLLEIKAKRYRLQADGLCCSSKMFNRLKAAYLYTAAAYASYKRGAAGNHEAGQCYHFAGFEFWRLGHLNPAGRCYKWSGDIFVNNKEFHEAIRAYRGAIRVFQEAGYSEIVDILKNKENDVIYKTGTLIRPWWDKKGDFFGQLTSDTINDEQEGQEEQVEQREQVEQEEQVEQKEQDEEVEQVEQERQEGQEEQIEKLLDFIKANLRPAFFKPPEIETEIQNQLEVIFNTQSFDFQREKITIPYSVKCYTPDFTFNSLSLALEVKLCKTPDREKRIVEEINSDIPAYQTQYRNLIFVVYDFQIIRDEAKFKSSIESNSNVYVVIVKH